MTPIERLKLLGALRQARTALEAAANPLEKLQQVKAIRALRLQLGASAPAAPAQEPAPPQPGVATAPWLQTLRDIAQGKDDAKGLQALFEAIQTAVNGLHGAGALEGEAMDVANAAITAWAELDLKLNGH